MLPLYVVNPYGEAMSHHLMGVAEIAQLLGVSRQRVTQLAKAEGFPRPVASLAAGPVWESADVEAWGRRVGRLVDG